MFEEGANLGAYHAARSALWLSVGPGTMVSEELTVIAGV